MCYVIKRVRLKSSRWQTFARVCAKAYSGLQLTALSRGPILGPSPVPDPAGDWGYDLCWSCVSTNSIPLLQSCRWLNHVLVKGVPQVSLLWVQSNSWVQLVPPSRSCHLLRVKTGKNVPQCFIIILHYTVYGK